MSVNTLIEFDDVLEHIFDTTKIEFSGGLAKLKSLVSPNEILFSNFDNDNDLTSKRGGKLLVFDGLDNTGQILNGKLNFPDQNRSGARYKNITDIVNDFSLRCEVTMNVVLASNRHIMVLKSNIDNAEIRWLTVDIGGGISRIMREIRNATGTLVDSKIQANVNFTTDPKFTIALSNDDDGNTISYFNGVLTHIFASPVWDFTDADLVFGDEFVSDNDVDNVQLFKSIEFAGGFANPLPEATTFSLVAQEIITNIPFIMDSWIEFIDNTTELEGSQIKHHVLRDSQRFFFDTVGVVWKIQDAGLDKFLQSNLDIIINSNLDKFPLTVGIGTTIQIVSLLKSSIDGYTTPILDFINLKYSLHFKSEDIGICVVSGTVFNLNGEPVVGATVEADGKKDFLIQNVFTGPKAKTTTNSDGRWSLSLIETASTQNLVTVTISFDNDGTIVSVPFKNLSIPDLPSKKFSEIVAGI